MLNVVKLILGLVRVSRLTTEENMRKLNGFRYSTTEFVGYKCRAIFSFEIKGSATRRDIYTTNTVKSKITSDVQELLKDKVDNLEMIHLATKRQDDACSELIAEFLGED
jgi:hypothetical protein